MRVSIITVVKDNERFIEDSIKSVLSQSYQSIEYIIIDGSSTDGTVEKIKKYSNKISKFLSEKDSGIYDAMNKGIELSTGDIIGFLNSDDVFANSEMISAIVQKFKNENIKGCYGDLVYMDKDLKRVIRYWKSGKYKKDAFRKGWMVPHPTLFLLREVYLEFGKFRTDFRVSADYEFMLRLIEKNGVLLYYIPNVLVKMRIGGKSGLSIKKMLLKAKEDMVAWRINGLKPPFGLNFIKPFRKISQFFKK